MDDKLVEMLARMDEKLTRLLNTDNDHEARIRELEKNDLGRIVPFLIGIGTLAALILGFMK